MGKLSDHTTQPIKRRINIRSRDKKILDSPDCLPKGWTVEIKSRKSGYKYKCYIAPQTGCKFYSKKQVSRYLKARKPKKKGVGMHSGSNVVVERNDKVDGLPPGWIQEVKVRNYGDNIRKDPYYTDPVTGYIFRSKKDALRYLDTGEIGKYAIKPKTEDVNVESTGVKPSPSSATKRRKLKGTGRCLFMGQCSNSNETVKDEHNLESVMGGTPLSQHASDQSGDCAAISSIDLVKAEESKKRQMKKVHTEDRLVSGPTAAGVYTDLISSDLLKTEDSTEGQGKKVHAENTCSSVPPAAVIPPEKQQLENGMEMAKHGNGETPQGLRKQKYKKVLDVPRRTSKRLAGLDADPATDLEAGYRTRLVVAVQPPVSQANLAIDFTASSSRAHQASEQQLNQLESEWEAVQPPLSQANLAMDFSASSSRAHQATGQQLNQLESEWEANTTLHSSKGTENPSESEKPLEKQANEFEMPLGDQTTQPKRETEGKADEKPGSPLILPFGDSWPDPCLEFAFKTLTGAISVEDNLAAVQDYFQLPPSSTQTHSTSEMTLPGFGTDGFCQTDELFQFDSLVKPSYPPELQEKPLIPPPSNESMLSFSESMLQQPSGEGKKDC